MEHERDTPPAPGRPASHALEPPRARVAAAALAGRGPPQALGLPLARHARAVRGLPVARPGDPARRWGGDADSGSADRKRLVGGRGAAVPRAARPGLPTAGGPLSQSAREPRSEVGVEAGA